MENTFQQFENSLTRQAEISMNQWSKELADMSIELMNDPMRIVNALNDKRNLCTPGFLMRRQIQAAFPELLEAASEESREVYADLFVSNNVMWPKAFVECLCSKLEKFVKTKHNQIVKASQWKAWLNDEAFPTKRELAVKLSFLLDMDDYTTTKFLLSCGHEPFSTRNPLDCICLFCKLLRPKGDWKKVEEILNQYEKNRPEKMTDNYKKTPSAGSIGVTYEINNKIPELASVSDPESKLVDVQNDLIEYMYSIDAEFTRRRVPSKRGAKTSPPYLSGYSLERCQKLLELTKYLVELYPGYDNAVYVGGDRRTDSRTKNKEKNKEKTNSNKTNKEKILVPKIIYSEEEWKNVRIDDNGYPNLPDLSKAFVYLHEWDFAEPSGLGLVDINPETGKAFRTSARKEKHDKIPFNNDVYMICKAYSENNRLSSIALTLNQTDVVPVERKDILLMAYLFISAYSRKSDDPVLRNTLYEMADSNSDTDTFSADMKSIIGQLEDIVIMLDDDNKIAGYISCINQFLRLFNFEPFYPPFLLDRFILFALVGEEIGSSFLTEDGLPENLTSIWLYDGYASISEN